MKYILTTGRTEILVNGRSVPGIVGMLLQSCGRAVTYLRLEPQLNQDVGSMDLRLKGEVFVLADGSEVALPVGVFERCCDVTLTGDSYLTLGTILRRVIARAQNETRAPLVSIETAVREYIGEHFRRAACGWREGGSEVDYLVVDVGEVLTSTDMGSMLLAAALRAAIGALSPADYLVLNIEDSEDASTPDVCALVGQFIKDSRSSVSETSILSLLISEKSNSCYILDSPLSRRGNRVGVATNSVHPLCSFGIFRLLGHVPFFDALEFKETSHEARALAQADAVESLDGREKGRLARIAILAEFEAGCRPYHCVEAALRQAAADNGHAVEVVHLSVGECGRDTKSIAEALEGVSGVLLPGGFGAQFLDAKLAFVEYARVHGIPFLGVCLGYQLAIIEFARNVLNVKGATSEEFDAGAAHRVIRRMCHERCANTGRDMLLGSYPVEYRGCARDIYSASMRPQRFRHRYALDNAYKGDLERAGMRLVGKSGGDRIVAFKLQGHRFFAGVQYHPELGSKYAAVDPVISAFVAEVLGKRP